MFAQLVSEALLLRLQESFSADIAGMASLSHDRIQQTIGEQRVIQVLRQWSAEQDPFREAP